MKRTKLLPAICVLTALMLLLSGCAHPWRIASNPNPATPMPDNGTDAPSTDVITSGEPADSAVPTETLTSEPYTAAPTRNSLSFRQSDGQAHGETDRKTHGKADSETHCDPQT